MKATIQGIRYDTDTAVFLARVVWCAPGRGSVNWHETLIYRTPRSGRFFMAGSGGAATTWRGGQGIRALTTEAATRLIGRRKMARFINEGGSNAVGPDN